MEPIYTPHNTQPAYQLNWGLTIFWNQPPLLDEIWLADLQRTTEPDGVRVLKHQTTTNGASQFFVSTKPSVSPSELVRSVKGRLQHAIRERTPKAFRRNYCLRSIGSAKRRSVEDYVATQLEHHRMADASVQKRLARSQERYSDVDLGKPSFSSHAEYWYNLHLVIVNDERWMEIREDILSEIETVINRVAAKYACRLSRVALLADHVHMIMGCPVDLSPERVALAYLNNFAFARGMKPVFRYGYYVGTIGEYDRGAV